MNTIVYDSTARTHLGDLPAIIIRKDSVIVLNKAACALMGVGSGDRIAFFQDKDAPDKWYVKTSDTGFPLGKEMQFGCKKLSQIFKCILGKTEGRILFDSRVKYSNGWLLKFR